MKINKTMVDVIKAWLHKLFEEYKFVRRVGIVGIYALITFVTITIFTQLSAITTAVASAYATLCGLLAVIFKFYNDSRNK